MKYQPLNDYVLLKKTKVEEIINCKDYNYTKFNLNACGTKGWIQKNKKDNDCWLDSALYYLFGSTNISKKSSDTLDKI